MFRDQSSLEVLWIGLNAQSDALSATWSQSSFYGMHRMFVMNPCMGPSFTHFFYTLGTIAVDFGIRFYFEIVQFYIHEAAVNCQVLSQYVYCLHPCKFQKNPLYTCTQSHTYTCHKCTMERIVTCWRPSHFHFHYSDILHTVSHAVSTYRCPTLWEWLCGICSGKLHRSMPSQ